MDDLDKYVEQGFLFPLGGLSASEASRLMRRVDVLEESRPGWLFARTTKKPHLLLTWLNRLIRDPRILDPVEQILGPNLLCWDASFFAKLPRDPGLVTWH